MKRHKLKISPGKWVVNGSAVKANFLNPNEVIVAEVNHIPKIVGLKAAIKEQHANLGAIASIPDWLELFSKLHFHLKCYGGGEGTSLGNERNELLRDIEVILNDD